MILSHAGIAQRREHRPATPGFPPAGDTGKNPVPRSTILQAFAAGLRQDPQAWELGRADAAAGRRWAPPAGADPFSYACGYAEGEKFRKIPEAR